ncbi:PadR family transcriptional regulator [Brevibacillus choshinensis]|uniref:PadR family transcriptional regulator n=1 Tax=Brevibacillus choshinensis TaxID=54911 RepID=UPI002E1CE816|nr:PadR family transcriptional regulator [Brevibacillus choshinensis]
MSSIRYALLSLLAREPLSGYDIKLQMNSRLGPFWKAGSNQVYPEMAKMEAEGLIELQAIEQNTYRPARKVYEITDIGRDVLKEWTLEAGELEKVRDDFLLKVYNSWIVDPEQMIVQIGEIKKQHEERLAAYEEKIEELTDLVDNANRKDPLVSSISVVEFGVQYERLYIEWCDSLMKKMK